MNEKPGANALSRRSFLTSAAVGAAGLLMPAANPMAMTTSQNPEPLKAELVKEFVIAAHAKLDRVQEMLESEPNLLNATWDWKAGDFESAIGGAGHMGRRDIANYLLGKGARMDVFVAAMLGKLDIVRTTLGAYPNLKDSRGPHGISLLRHAQAGGEDAKPVVEYLQSLGLVE